MKTLELTRNCPKCDRVITYKTHTQMVAAKRINSLCKHCGNLDHIELTVIVENKSVYTRECITCGKEMVYNDYTNYRKSFNGSGKCKHCSNIGKHITTIHDPIKNNYKLQWHNKAIAELKIDTVQLPLWGKQYLELHPVVLETLQILNKINKALKQ